MLGKLPAYNYGRLLDKMCELHKSAARVCSPQMYRMTQKVTGREKQQGAEDLKNIVHCDLNS